jgi:WD40 repeat protein
VTGDAPFTAAAFHPDGLLLAVGLANAKAQIWEMRQQLPVTGFEAGAQRRRRRAARAEVVVGVPRCAQHRAPLHHTTPVHTTPRHTTPSNHHHRRRRRRRRHPPPRARARTRTHAGGGAAFSGFSFSENGYHVAATSPGGVSIWDLRKMKCIKCVCVCVCVCACVCVCVC